jgi:hypothetical protein
VFASPGSIPKHDHLFARDSPWRPGRLRSTGTGDMVCPTAAALELTPPGSTQFVTLHGAGARIAPYAGSDTRAGCGIVRLTALTAKNLA